MKEFIFNEHNVCTNPNIYFEVVEQSYEVQIKTAQQPNGGWVWGFLYGFYGGCGAVPCDISLHPFSTENEAGRFGLTAVRAAFEEQIAHLQDIGHRESQIQTCRKAIQCINKELEPKQLELAL